MEKINEVRAFKTTSKVMFIVLNKAANKASVVLRKQDIHTLLDVSRMTVSRNLQGLQEYHCDEYSIWEYSISNIPLMNKKGNTDNLIKKEKTTNVTNTVQEKYQTEVISTYKKPNQVAQDEIQKILSQQPKRNNLTQVTLGNVEIEREDGSRIIIDENCQVSPDEY